MVVELLYYDLFIILYNTKRKRKVRKTWKLIHGGARRKTDV